MRRGLWYFLSAQKVRKKTVLFLGYSLYKANFYMFFVAQRTKRSAFYGAGGFMEITFAYNLLCNHKAQKVR